MIATKQREWVIASLLKLLKMVLDIIQRPTTHQLDQPAIEKKSALRDVVWNGLSEDSDSYQCSWI